MKKLLLQKVIQGVCSMEDLVKKYPSPKKGNAAFDKYWATFLGDISDRENLKASHLTQLKILCSICVEYDELEEAIELEGRTYTSVGRNGTQVKTRPEVELLKTCRIEIRNYSKILGLVLVKDTRMSNVVEDKNEFTE
jgi:hypothetical protein